MVAIIPGISPINKNAAIMRNQNIEKIIQTVLKKYSEMVEDNISANHKTHIETFKNKGTSLPSIIPPNVNILDTFKAKCTKDVVMIIQNKLQQIALRQISQINSLLHVA